MYIVFPFDQDRRFNLHKSHVVMLKTGFHPAESDKQPKSLAQPGQCLV